jgi:hypothetical protein
MERPRRRLFEEPDKYCLGFRAKAMTHDYTIDEQIRCVRRELAMRKSVYPRRVSDGKMKADAAAGEINCMQAVHDTLVAVKEGMG